MRDYMNIVENAHKPWMDDHGDDEPTYDEWSPEHGIDSFVRSTFSTGGCGYLALVLHEKTGWPIYAEIDVPEAEWHEHGGGIDHIWVVNHSYQAVDINGVHPEEFAQSKYNDPDWGPNKEAPHLNPRIGKRGDVVQLSHDYLLTSCRDAELLKWAEDLVELFPQHFGLR